MRVRVGVRERARVRVGVRERVGGWSVRTFLWYESQKEGWSKILSVTWSG